MIFLVQHIADLAWQLCLMYIAFTWAQRYFQGSEREVQGWVWMVAGVTSVTSVVLNAIIENL